MGSIRTFTASVAATAASASLIGLGAALAQGVSQAGERDWVAYSPMEAPRIS